MDSQKRMTSIRLLLLLIISVTAAPHSNSVNDDNSLEIDSLSNDIDLPSEVPRDNKIVKSKLNATKDFKLSDDLPVANPKYSKLSRKNRIHKTLQLNYSYIPKVFNKYTSNQDRNSNDFTEEKSTTGHRKKQESNIYYVRLPPSPYFYVPGLGYISNPPSFSTSSLRPQINYSRPHHQAHQQKPTPFINVPIDFISNGKPVHVYQWENPRKPTKRPSTSTVIKLKKGPYGFNGKPTSLYLLSPDGHKTNQQNIIQTNNLY